jgi:hypothetical protein
VHLPVGSEENNEKPLRIADPGPEILNCHLVVCNVNKCLILLFFSVIHPAHSTILIPI